MSVTHKQDVWPIVTSSGHLRVGIEQPPRFAVGDRVQTHNVNIPGHTRLPRYARSRCGTVHRVHGGFPTPETMAHDQGPQPQYVYSVRFEARELWGPEARSGDAVYADMWESYLEPAMELNR